ncbi:NAD(P)H-hydrate epimerase [Agromyces larvae]|uniref:NAD(P)H-hydrate epimerase n=1 Tax=Agromyces larvae TaxID=2929802 RepID=A0ABY4C839_9MICO|nr:NAD(P)H-hydrate epimerase [Agromyces larvae]UOE44845.1 NAD(P)H-hydrate epimerase [Agromyces larvae]
MVAGYSAEQVRTAEAPHLAAGEPLMRRAASALAAAIRRERAAAPRSEGPVLLLVGPGDNGGDALFAGAELAADGIEVLVAPVATRRHAAGEAAARMAGARFVGDDGADAAAIAATAAAAAVVVDGILGTGTTTGTAASPALRGAARDIVLAVRARLEASDRSNRAIVIAVDLPSGVHPDDGTVPDPAVLHADLTVTFGAVKAGTLLEPAAAYAGRLELVDLGLGAELSTMTPLVERA